MISKRNLATAILGGLILAGATASTASARCSSGEIANFFCSNGLMSKADANNLDRYHAAMGRPLDHAANTIAGTAANFIVPGSGPYVTGALEARDWYNRHGFNGGLVPNPAPRPIGDPVAQPGGYFPQIPRVQMGNVCVTPYGSFLGPFNPVGSYCQAVTMYGVVVGRVL